MENNFSAESSLRLISETIERSRRTIAKNSGKPLILWGALVTITAIVIWLLWSKTGSAAWNFLWFAMTAVGMICMATLLKGREKAPDTEVTRMLGKIWGWFGIFSTGFFALVWAAWGTILTKRPYLPGCVKEMVDIGKRYNALWLCAGHCSKAGHPHHPLYLKKDEKTVPFDIDSYLKEITP